MPGEPLSHVIIAVGCLRDRCAGADGSSGRVRGAEPNTGVRATYPHAQTVFHLYAEYIVGAYCIRPGSPRGRIGVPAPWVAPLRPGSRQFLARTPRTGLT